MICAQCETAGERSRVFPGGIDVTVMEVQEYWDEDGVFITDDPNTVTRTYACSNGHNWRTQTLRGDTTVHNLEDTPDG